VVRDLLGCQSLQHATAAAQDFDPRAFEQFRVVIVHHGRVAVATSDGTAIHCTQPALHEPLLFTSSSLGDAIVETPRRRLFDRIVVRNRGGWLAGQARFHRHQWSRRPEISVRMERRDALTVSRTSIDVTNDRARLLYEAPLDVGVPARVQEWCSLH
jgi:hypothetical protein